MRADRGALQSLCATSWRPPSYPTPYRAVPGWWEHQAQSFVRSISPPLPPEQGALVAEADGRLLGVVHFEVLPGAAVEMRVLAVSVDARRTGVGSTSVAALIAHPRLTGLTVLAYVHHDNVASRALLVTCGFTLTSAPVQEWLAAIR